MIQFANPAALWLLAFIPALIILYLLKRKRTEKTVPSLMLWKQALDDVRAQVPFQKLRSNLLLLLQILVIVLIAAILSEPFLQGETSQSQRWILVIDASAGMQSTDISPTRFSAARKELESLLRGLKSSDEVMLLATSCDTRILASFTRNHAMIRSELERLQADDCGSRWPALQEVLESLSREKPSPKIVIASDFANFRDQNIPFDAINVGTGKQNLAITRFSSQHMPAAVDRHSLFFEIKNFGDSFQKSAAEIYFDDALQDSYDVQLAPGATMTRTIELVAAKRVEARLKLNHRDSLALDNESVIFLTPRKTISIRLLSRDPYLQRALSVLPHLKESQTGEFVIQEIQSMSSVPAQPGVFFIRGSAKSGAIIVQKSQTHPVMAFVEPELWRIGKHDNLSTPNAMDVLFESESGPLAIAVRTEKLRQIIVGFSLEESDMHRYAGFPIFLQNSIEWLAGSLESTTTAETGPVFRKEKSYEMNGRSVFANFVSADESNISPSKQGSSAAGTGHTVVSKRDLKPIFLILLIAVVILEWYGFHRKMDAVAAR